MNTKLQGTHCLTRMSLFLVLYTTVYVYSHIVIYIFNVIPVYVYTCNKGNVGNYLDKNEVTHI